MNILNQTSRGGKISDNDPLDEELHQKEDAQLLYSCLIMQGKFRSTDTGNVSRV